MTKYELDQKILHQRFALNVKKERAIACVFGECLNTGNVYVHVLQDWGGCRFISHVTSIIIGHKDPYSHNLSRSSGLINIYIFSNLV